MIINEEDAVSGTGTSGWFSNVIWCDNSVSEIVNVFTSELCLYPSGALTSSTVYVPFAKSVNTYGSVVDVNCATVFPAESFTNRTAPANAFPVEASTFTILTTVLYAVLLMTYCVRMEIAYFDRESLQREDGKKYYQR